MSNTATIEKKDGTDIAITIITSILVIAFVLALFPCGIWIYLKTNPQAGPDTSAVTYTGTIKDENGAERSLLELEYWENKDGLGKEVAEISFNAYTGNDNTTVIQKGVQFMNIAEASLGADALYYDLYRLITEKRPLEFFKQVSYDKVAGHSFQSIEEIEPGTKMFIDIDGASYCFIMNGTYTTYTKQFNFGKSFLNAFRGLAGLANYYDSNTWYDYLPVVHNYTMNDFYNEVFKCLLSSDVGYGTYKSNFVDLGKFFEIKRLNTEKQQWESVTAGHDTVKSYFSVKVTKHAEGLKRAKESNFKQYDGDADFTTCPTDEYFEDYTTVKPTDILSAADFNYSYYANLGGYIATIKEEVAASLSSNKVYTISINVNDEFFGKTKNIVGIHITDKNYYNFIQSVNINLNQSGEANFYMIDKLTPTEFESLPISFYLTNTSGTVSGIKHRGEQ